MMLIQHRVKLKSDGLFNTQSKVLPADWSILENNEKATLNFTMAYHALFFTIFAAGLV